MKYRFRTKPYDHQRKGVSFVLTKWRDQGGAALLFDPRTGKTKTTIDAMCAAHLKWGLRKVLIVAPNRVLGTWVTEVATHAPLVVQTIVWDAKARRRGIPPMQSAYDIQVLITNYETFSTPGRRTPSGRRSRANGRFKHRDMLRKWIGDDVSLIVCDEGHKLKNPSGKASNLIVSMRDDFTYRLILTGTPITKAKRAADIYMQWQLIAPHRFAKHWPTYEAFRDGTGVWTTQDNIPIWRRAKPEGMARLQRGLHADGMVIKREECFDLPARMPDRLINVPLSPATARAYDDMAETMVAELENGDIAEASIPLVATLRLSQITSGFVGIKEPDPHNEDKFITRAVRIGHEKIKALQELLVEETIERDEAVIIVARFNPDLNAIERLCTRLDIPHWSIRGGSNRSATDDALRAFKRTDGARAMVVQPSAGGVGLDMSVAPHMIWFSLIPSWVDYKQMNDRNALHQHGTQATYLMAPGTIDHVLYNTLQLDGDVSKAILTRPRSILRRSR